MLDKRAERLAGQISDKVGEKGFAFPWDLIGGPLQTTSPPGPSFYPSVAAVGRGVRDTVGRWKISQVSFAPGDSC